MRRATLFLIFALPVLRADVITPVITKTITTTGTGFAQASAFATLESNQVTSGVDVSVKTLMAGDTANASINLQAEYIALGSGAATLNYTAEGGADGSQASAGVRFQLNDLSGSCFIETCSGVGGPGGSETIQLGAPFYLSLAGNASAGFPLQGGFGEDAGGFITLNFSVTQDGVPVEITQIALPTPEPSTFGLAAVSSLVFAFALWRKFQNTGAGRALSVTTHFRTLRSEP